MHYFDVILLNDVIGAVGPKVTRRVTYIFKSECKLSFRNSSLHALPYYRLCSYFSDNIV